LVDPLIYKNNFTDKWFYFLGGFAEKSDADKIYFRSLANSGLGFNLWRENNENTADFFLGLGYRYEDARGKRAFQEFPTISVGIFHKNVIFGDWELTQQITYDIPVENSDNSFGYFTNQLRIPFSEQWSFNTFLRLSYFSQPANSDSTLNTSFRWGIQYTFK
jgi:hypothetical protein